MSHSDSDFVPPQYCQHGIRWTTECVLCETEYKAKREFLRRYAAPPASQWIKCSDRLPPACHDVIAYAKKIGDRTHRVRQIYVSTRPREVVEDFEMTHWMPLPAPPKDEQ